MASPFHSKEKEDREGGGCGCGGIAIPKIDIQRSFTSWSLSPATQNPTPEPAAHVNNTNPTARSMALGGSATESNDATTSENVSEANSSKDSKKKKKK